MNRVLLVAAAVILSLGATGCTESPEKAKAEVAKAEAERAKAEADRAKAEAERAKYEAERKKAEADRVRYEASKPGVPPAPVPPTVPVPPPVPAPPSVEVGKQFVEANAKEICKFAYEYADYAYKSHTFDGHTTSEDGYYVLAYTWSVKGAIYTRSMTLELVFTNAGTFDHLGVKRHDALYDPFDLRKYYLDELKGQVKNLNGVKDNAKLKQEVDEASAKRLCELYLKRRQQ